MKQLIFAFAVASLPAFAQQDQAHYQGHGDPTSSDAQIVVTINPEARVSAVVGSSMPPTPKCGEATELRVQIVNQGFVTAPLRATVVGDGKSRVALHMDAAKLNGGPQDIRLLHFMSLVSGPTDVTVAFSIDNNVGDLGGRDRVSLLLMCND